MVVTGVENRRQQSKTGIPSGVTWGTERTFRGTQGGNSLRFFTTTSSPFLTRRS